MFYINIKILGFFSFFLSVVYSIGDILSRFENRGNVVYRLEIPPRRKNPRQHRSSPRSNYVAYYRMERLAGQAQSQTGDLNPR